MATLVTTSSGKIRFSYAHVWEPKAAKQGQEPKYSCALLIPKTDTSTLSMVTAAIAEAKQLGVTNGTYKGKNTEVPTFKGCLRDGDLEKPDNPEYHGCYFINANNKSPVGVIGPDAKRISDLARPSFYSGCYGNFSVNFFPFNFDGSIGVGAGLNAVQKVSDGEQLAGMPDPETVFQAIENAESGSGLF